MIMVHGDGFNGDHINVGNDDDWRVDNDTMASRLRLQLIINND